MATRPNHVQQSGSHTCTEEEGTSFRWRPPPRWLRGKVSLAVTALQFSEQMITMMMMMIIIVIIIMIMVMMMMMMIITIMIIVITMMMMIIIIMMMIIIIIMIMTMMTMMMIIIIISISIIITFKGANRDFFYNLLTAPRTVSSTYTQVAQTQLCANPMQHNTRLSRASCRVTCHVVRRGSTAIKFDRVEIAFI